MYLSTEERLVSEKKATLSSCCGFLGEVTLTDSAIIILFSGALGAGDMFSMITTSILPLLNGICIIPMAFFAAKTGAKRIIKWAMTFACIAYFGAVSAPFFGGYAKFVLIGMIIMTAFCLTGFIAGWFPLLDTFLTPERRSHFFGRMRFCHQLTAVCFLIVCGFLVGKNPPLWKLQTILYISAFIFCGRAWFISRLPELPVLNRNYCNFRDGLVSAVGNSDLTSFSIYMFVLNLTSFGTIPLMIIYLKRHLQVPDNILITISAFSLAGMLFGYLLASRLIRIFGTKKTLIVLHVSFALVNFILFFVSSVSLLTYMTITALLFSYSFMVAIVAIVSSSEMMHLATKDNKTLAMAFSGALFYGGSGIARLISSLLLGSGLLAANWQLGKMNVTHYQSLLLIYAISITTGLVFLVLIRVGEKIDRQA